MKSWERASALSHEPSDMKKIIRFLILGFTISVFLTTIFLFWRVNAEAPENKDYHHPVPSRMLKLGPVVGGAVSSETVGDVVIKLKASRLWLKKTKTLGFDNALFKKLAARDFCLTIYKGGKKLISVRKPFVEMPPDQHIIEINDPAVIYPPNMKQPDSIRLDKRARTLCIRTGRSEKIWDLAKM
jgi:hypothetical protein